MSTDITTFVFPQSNANVRTLTIDDDPWFVAKDVCDALGLDNVAMATKRLDSDEVNQIELLSADNRLRSHSIINEPGLYSLIIRSDKPNARDFRRWITHEVLPSIRKTGRYDLRAMTPREIAEMIIKESNRADLAEERLAIAAPKVEIYDEWIETGHHVNMKTFAKRIGFRGSAAALCKVLRDIGVFVQYRVPVGDFQDWANFPTEPWTEYFTVFNTRIKQGVYRDTAFILPPGQVLVWKELRRHGHDVQRPIID